MNNEVESQVYALQEAVANGYAPDFKDALILEMAYELEQRKRMDALDVKQAMEENDERFQETE